MIISRKEVQHIAELVRLKLSETEIKKYQKQLGEILDYVSQLKKIGVKNIKPFSGADLQNVFRPDEAKQKNIKQVESLIKQSPEQEKGLIKTKGIFSIKTSKH